MTPVMFVAGSVVLAALNLAGLILIAFRRRAGWLVLLAGDVLALPYQYATWQYGFLVTGVISGGIAWAAYMSWGHAKGRHRGRRRMWRRSTRSRRRMLAATLSDGVWSA